MLADKAVGYLINLKGSLGHNTHVKESKIKGVVDKIPRCALKVVSGRVFRKRDAQLASGYLSHITIIWIVSCRLVIVVNIDQVFPCNYKYSACKYS